MGNQSTTEIIDNSEFENELKRCQLDETEEMIELENNVEKYRNFVRIEYCEPIYNKNYRGSKDMFYIAYPISYTIGIPFGKYFHVVKKIDAPYYDYCTTIKAYHEIIDTVDNHIIPNLGNFLNIK
jgi:hypothetical protein